MNEMLEEVKRAINIDVDDHYRDDTISGYIDEVIDFLVDAGILRAHITVGLVARGVSDLWACGLCNGKLSEYFMQRATQLSYKGGA